MSSDPQAANRHRRKGRFIPGATPGKMHGEDDGADDTVARKGFSLGELATRFGCVVQGDPDVRVTHVASPVCRIAVGVPVRWR